MTRGKNRPLKLQRRKGTKHLKKEDLAKALRRSQRIKAVNKANIQTSCTGVLDIICLNKYCDVCLLKFPSDDIVKNKYCEVKESLGSGLFAKSNIKAGSYICQYSGKRSKKKPKGNYVVQLLGGFFIDAKKSECVARYINHSCNPNADFRYVTREKSKKKKKRRGRNDEDAGEDTEMVDEVWILANKNIKKGEEITASYGDNSKDFFVDRKCLCDLCKR